MGFCTNCGNEIPDGASVCGSCGVVQTTSTPTTTSNPDDKGGFLWGLLGCCIPIVGLILFLAWKGNKPKTAKAAGIGAIVGVVIIVIYYIVAIALGIGMGAFNL